MFLFKIFYLYFAFSSFFSKKYSDLAPSLYRLSYSPHRLENLDHLVLIGGGIGVTPLALYYFCGSVSFMKAINQALKELEIPKERIHYEAFSPIAILDEE